MGIRQILQLEAHVLEGNALQNDRFTLLLKRIYAEGHL
jgi:hypothetical protein